MKLKSIKIYLLKIPFSFSIDHNLKQRSSSESIIIEVTNCSGKKGFGEGAPRYYVTGETGVSIMNDIEKIWSESKIEEINSIDDIKEFQKKIYQQNNSSLAAAFEIALLDLWSQNLSCSIADFFRQKISSPLIYSAIIPFLSSERLNEVLLLIKRMQIKQIKIKVGLDRDMKNLKQIRDFLGDDVDLRIDGNRCWNVYEATEKLNAFDQFNISYVEEPLISKQNDKISELSNNITIPIILDESVCTMNDAKKLSRDINPERLMFNLKLSKMGGLMNASRIYLFAKECGIKCQLGCNVGETAILSAAGRIFAQTHSLEYLEGSAAAFFMEDDIAVNQITFGKGGESEVLVNQGLGIQVDTDKLSKYSILTKTLQVGYI